MELTKGLGLVVEWRWRGVNWISGDLALLVLTMVFICFVCIPLGLCSGDYQCLMAGTVGVRACLEECTELGNVCAH